MDSVSEGILKLLALVDGRTDREITDALRGHTANQQPVNAACRKLAARGIIERRRRADGLIGNFLLVVDRIEQDASSPAPSETQATRLRSAGDSTEQRTAETRLIEGLARKLGVNLTKRELRLPDGGKLELDGSCNTPPIVCEAWAHIGPAKVAQKHKLMTDAFKLIFASQFLPKETRKILVLADAEAAKHLRGNSWMAQALKANKVELQIIDLPQETVELVRAAQKRQYR